MGGNTKVNDKLTFWKKLKISITDFEGYQDLAAEKVIKTILYIFILMLIFSIVTTALYTYKFMNMVKGIRQYISQNIETITFQDNKLGIIPYDGEKEIEIANEDGFQILINTNIKEEEEKNTKIEDIKLARNGILVLEDKVVIKNEMLPDIQEYSYEEIAKEFGIDSSTINKDNILQYLY